MIQTQIGELIVGAHLRLIEDCELVSYNQRSKEAGKQMEIDVLGVKSSSGTQTVYACEVVTHLDGALYSGKPDTDEWAEYGNKGYQYTLERLWEKFNSDHQLVQEVFDDADEYIFQFWSPVVPEGYLTEGLKELQRRFEADYDGQFELMVNAEYTDRVKELQELAGETKKSYDEPAFRFIQILENLQ